jgi:hypothetical protein
MAVSLLAALLLVVSGTLAGTWLPAWSDDVDLPLVALRPGEPGRVGDYEVTVDALRMPDDATTDRRSPAEGRYVEADVTVTYVGDGVGVVDEDLLVSYAGSSDDWLYDEWGCAAVTESPVTELDPLGPGDTATFVSCMDVPAEVVDEPAVIVEDLAGDVFTAEMWGER